MLSAVLFVDGHGRRCLLLGDVLETRVSSIVGALVCLLARLIGLTGV